MKIISKGKDYYDYLQGIYGIDEKFILDRTKFLHKTQYPVYNQPKFVIPISVYIGDYQVDGFYTEVGFYFGQRIKNELKVEKYFFGEYYEFRGHKVYRKGKNNPMFLEPINIGEKSLSYRYDFPIILRYDYIFELRQSFEYPNPVLSDLGIASVVPPEECWNMIYNWLSKRETMKENIEEPDDKTKIINKGFDLKKSFRHRKNE